MHVQMKTHELKARAVTSAAACHRTKSGGTAAFRALSDSSTAHHKKPL